mgnify:CR=1 FL=1
MYTLPKLERFNQDVLSKYHIYNSVFITLPFDSIDNTGDLLPLFTDVCVTGFKKLETPVEIVDFFNGRNPLRQMVVKNIYNKYTDYISFWDKYDDSTEFADEIKKQADKLKTPLFRNKFLDRSNKK